MQSKLLGRYQHRPRLAGEHSPIDLRIIDAYVKLYKVSLSSIGDIFNHQAAENLVLLDKSLPT
jgi:hypothetical protein